MSSSEHAPGSAPEVAWHAIVLSWNGREDTLRCLESLSRVEHPELRIVCVDNGSSDGSQRAVRERFPHVALIEAGANLGYSGGNNLGIRHALEHGARWVALVNNDATVATDFLAGFEAAARERPGAGILAGKVYFADRPTTVWFAGQRVSELLGYSGRPRGYGREDGPRYDRVDATDRAVGALMAISREAIDAAGLLDDELFAYVEDVDWALRVRDAGFEIVFAPRARAWHSVSASTGGEKASTHTLYYGVRNTVTVLERRRPLGAAGTALRRASILATFSLHALTRADRRAALRAVQSGFADARAGRLGQRPPVA
ncbi:MAG TPA: glycosyltransferase family 2 protein [Solirubrobacteraceae bacterium]|jgi:GT2 family glycosyltransferase|nr:glycosyltransferase family 2 protein [Solirubrobacteraceae bacterium]